MRRLASEVIRDLKKRVARLENRSAGYPQGYEFDMSDYDSSDSSMVFKDDYFDSNSDDLARATLNRARSDKKSINRLLKPHGCKIVKVDPNNANFITLNCMGDLIELKARRRAGNRLDVLVNGKKVDDINVEMTLWGPYTLDTDVSPLLKVIRKALGQTRLASTRKVAGHIVLAGAVDVDTLRLKLKRVHGVEDIELDDDVLSFLLDSANNPAVVRKVKSIAKEHGLKFEQGVYTDGLGMIYTKKASSRRTSRRTRRASKPMFELKLIKEEVLFDDDESGDYTTDYEDMMEEKVYSFDDLLEELERVARDASWGEWSSSRPEVDGDMRSDWINSYEEQDYRTGASIRYSLHFNPARGVELDETQIKMIEKTLGM